MLFGIDAWVLWLAATAIFVIGEFITAFQLVTIWFAAGALCAMLVSFAGVDLFWQIFIFAMVSLVLLTVVLKFKPFDKQKSGVTPTNSDRVIGQTGLVIEEINPTEGTGQAKVLGQIWSAISENGEIIPVGIPLIVKGISGVKLVVVREK